MNTEVHKNVLKKLLYLFLMGICLSFQNDLLAKTDTTLLSGKNTTYWEPDESLRIKLGSDFANQNPEELSLEMDDIDVSEMVIMDSDLITFTPVQAIVPGSHRISLMRYNDMGESQTIGSWDFEVRQSETFKQYGATANVQMTATYRADEHNLSSPLPKRSQYQGSTQVNYAADTGNWHTQGQFDLIYNSSNNGEFGARKLDNGEFLFTGGNQNTQVQIGHQTLADGSLVMEGFHRRGVSVSEKFSESQSSITGFMLASDNVVGFRRGMAISDPNRRVKGVSFIVDPFADGSLSMSGTWLGGSALDESGFIDSIDNLETGESKGTAKSLAINSQLFESRLQLSLEYAITNFDSNNIDLTPSKNDNAYRFRANYGDSSESGVAWTLALEADKTGAFFQSLANQGMQADNKQLLVNSGLQWSTVGVQASFQRLSDNVDARVELPRIRSDVANVAVNWSPQIENPDKWYGTPSFDVAYSNQTQKQTLTPVDSFLPATDTTVNGYQANANFSYSESSWGLSFSRNNLRDASGQQDDTNTTSIGINSNFSFLEQQLTLSPTFQFDTTRDLILNQTSDSITYGVQSTFIIMKDILDGSVMLSKNNNKISDNSLNSNTSTANLILNWHALIPKPNRPGIDIGISGQYNDIKDKIMVLNSLGTYQIFITVNIVFPAQVGIVQ